MVRDTLQAAANAFGIEDACGLFHHFDHAAGTWITEGEFDLKQFVAVCRKAGIKKKTIRREELVRLFELIDADGSGAIDSQEFRAFMQSRGITGIRNGAQDTLPAGPSPRPRSAPQRRRRRKPGSPRKRRPQVPAAPFNRTRLPDRR